MKGWVVWVGKGWVGKGGWMFNLIVGWLVDWFVGWLVVVVLPFVV